MARLTLTGIGKRYGPTVALSRADLDLHPGEVHVLMGSNGSGKSTLCKIVAGSVRPDEGQLTWEGQEISIASPRDAAARGIGIFYQELSLAWHRTVAENIALPRLPVRAGLVDRAGVARLAEAQIAPFAEVAGDGFGPDVPVSHLRPDQRQLVEIMKCLASDARVMIFDEPTSALDRAQTARFFDVLRGLKAEGRSIVFISHRMDEIFEIGDRVTVIRDGTTVATAPLSDTSQERIIADMVGEEAAVSPAGEDNGTSASPVAPDVPMQGTAAVDPGVDAPARDRAGRATDPAPRSADASTTAPLLQVRGLTGARLRDVSFTLAAGEIVALGGLHGQGQSALLRTLFGAEPATRGGAELAGAPLDIRSPRAAIRAGLAYVSGDRGRDGAITDRPILENTVPIHFLRRRMALARPGPLSARAKEALSALATRYAGLSASIGSLSGGNQQKVVIARWLIDPPKVLLLDDPTKGIDLATKTELFALIRRLAAEGMGVVLHSSEDAEILANADRILVFNGGRISRELAGEERTRFNLYEAAYDAGPSAPPAEGAA